MKKNHKITKLLMLTLVGLFAVLFLTACGGDIDEDLVGRWVWEGSPAYQLVFEADGTGEWTGLIDSFEWEIRDENIRMDDDEGRRTWSYTIEGDVLTIQRTEPGMQNERWVYFRYVELTTDVFVGTWAWNMGPEFQLIFEADGTGEWVGVVDSITWEFVNGELRIDTGVMVEIWRPSIIGDILLMESLQEIGLEYVYIRQ